MGIFFFLFSLLFLAVQTSNCATVVVDGVTKWTDPIANIGDTIMFKHKNHYKLYIFRNKDAFNACDFTQATRLSNPSSITYTWHPSRPGNFYFSFHDGTNKPCREGQKLAVKVNPHSTPATSPASSPMESPDGVVSLSPAYPWPFQPREKGGSRSNTGAGGEVSPAPSMSLMIPGKGGSIPFISSNPVVPLPTGEVDSATIGLLPKSVNHAAQKVKVVGLIEGLIYLSMFCSYVMVMI